MEKSFFPENKDVAHKIMMELPNKDLIKLCAMNRRLRDICYNYPDFWRNKFIKDYGEEAAERKPTDRSWKNHYMQVFIDLQYFKDNPISFLDFIAWGEGIYNSVFIDTQNKKLVPVLEAPEWFITNLFLLDLGEIKLQSFNPDDPLFHQEIFSHLKPVEFLSKIKVPNIWAYVHGITKIGDSYSPNYTYRTNIKEYLQRLP